MLTSAGVRLLQLRGQESTCAFEGKTEGSAEQYGETGGVDDSLVAIGTADSGAVSDA